MVNDGRRRDCLAGTGRPLDQRERPLEHRFDGINLRMVQLRQTRSRKILRQLALQRLLLEFVPKKSMVDVPGHGGLIDGKVLHGILHPIKRDALPDVLRHKVNGAVHRHLTFSNLEANLVGNAVGQLDDGADSFPRLALALVPQRELVTHHDFHFVAKTKVRHVLLVEPNIPSNSEIVKRVRLFGLFVVVRLKLDQWAKDVLVLVGIIVAKFYWDDILVHSGLVEIIQRGARIFLPELFQLVDLDGSNLACPILLQFRRELDEPRDESTVVNQRLPRPKIPALILSD
mmetsp:Transcript_22974/g.59977  ORF Transcript_22974/g.59977 Transcript_22974/m.59977 type:complete len:287 (-) Transcript_22974:691-1551(-)